jgi:hypothetical protein
MDYLLTFSCSNTNIIIFHFVDNSVIERVNALIIGLWNVFLTFQLPIKISLLIIPCWILFTIIGLLRFFELIGN